MSSLYYHAYSFKNFTGQIWYQFFYPRPVLAFGYCHHLRLCVCPCVRVCVYQSLACPHNNSSAVQTRITKFGSKKQTTLVKVLIDFGLIELDLQGQIPLESRILPHFELVRSITLHPFKLESLHFDQQCILVRFTCLLFCKLIDLDLQGQI